jgi:sulfate adenylyltransferase
MGAFKEPHGGELKNLYVGAADIAKEKDRSRDLPSWDLTQRQLCDLELLLNGAFSPLEGFLGEGDYRGVLESMRLESGVLWPMPITLDVTEAFAGDLREGDSVALRDPEGVLIATLEISSIYRPEKEAEARAVFGTADDTHPGVNYLVNRSHPVYLGGRLRGVDTPTHYDFKHLRDNPQELRERFRKLGWRRVVAFQTRNPMHRAHYELTFRAAREVEANLLIHPVVGMTKPGDVDHYTRVRCYEHVLGQYPDQTTALSLLPLAMRMGGPREAVWHALIRKNYGCTHFIVGRDHAGVGDYYGTYDAQLIFDEFTPAELGITPLNFEHSAWCKSCESMTSAKTCPHGPGEKVFLSGTKVRELLADGVRPPMEFSRPEVADVLIAWARETAGTPG